MTSRPSCLVDNFGDTIIYERNMTRRFLNIHIATGQTYRYSSDRVYMPIDPEVAIGSALEPCAAKRAKRTIPSL